MLARSLLLPFLVCRSGVVAFLPFIPFLHFFPSAGRASLRRPTRASCAHSPASLTDFVVSGPGRGTRSFLCFLCGFFRGILPGPTSLAACPDCSVRTLRNRSVCGNRSPSLHFLLTLLILLFSPLLIRLGGLGAERLALGDAPCRRTLFFVWGIDYCCRGGLYVTTQLFSCQASRGVNG